MGENYPDNLSVPPNMDNDSRSLHALLDSEKTDSLEGSLWDALSNIENRLDLYALKKTDQEEKQLADSMKAFLEKLNADKHIPLDFRLKVLHCLKQELDLFNATITTAMFNTHKIAVVLVQKEARTNHIYLPALIDIIASAIELAVKLLLIDLEQYRVPQIIVTRHIFELARLGLDASLAGGNTTAQETARLNKTLCNHEILRKLNLFGQPLIHQKKIWKELQHHTDILKPYLFHSGDTPDKPRNHYMMMINLCKPNAPGRIIQRLPNPIKNDCIIIPLDKFITTLNKRMHDTEAVLRHHHLQKLVLHTEKELEDSLFCNKAILDIFIRGKRAHRHTQTSLRVRLCPDLRKSIHQAFTDASYSTAVDSISATEYSSAWNIVDISRYGVRLERMNSASLVDFPNRLAGLNWLSKKRHPHPDQQPHPKWGVICWAREHKTGEQSVGIEFLDKDYNLAQVALARGQREIDDIPGLAVLVKPDKSPHTIIFPETAIHKGMWFMLLHRGQRAYFKVKIIITAGQNYTLCKIVRAESKPATA